MSAGLAPQAMALEQSRDILKADSGDLRPPGAPVVSPFENP